MTSAYAIVGAFALAHAGMACLAMATERQHHLRPGAARSATPRLTLRLAGSLSLALSLWIGVLAWGAGSGTITWFGMLSAVALPLILMISYFPKQVLASTLVAASVGTACLLAVLAR